MASSFTIFALFSVGLFAGIIEARKDPGEYRQSVANNDEAVIEVIEHLAGVGPALSNSKKITRPDYHQKKSCVDEDRSLVKDFKARVNPWAYGNGVGLKGGDSKLDNDFEPRPSATRYSDDVVGLEGEEDKLYKDFEPRPSVTRYNDDADLKGEHNKLDKDFELRPSVTRYSDDCVGLEGKEDKLYKDFEPRPSVTRYSDDADLKGKHKKLDKDFEPRPSLTRYQE